MAYLRKVLPLDLQRYLHQTYLHPCLNVVWEPLLGPSVVPLYTVPDEELLELQYIATNSYISVLEKHYEELVMRQRSLAGLHIDSQEEDSDSVDSSEDYDEEEDSDTVDPNSLKNMLCIAVRNRDVGLFGWIMAYGADHGACIWTMLLDVLQCNTCQVFDLSHYIFGLVRDAEEDPVAELLLEYIQAYGMPRIDAYVYLSRFALDAYKGTSQEEVYLYVQRCLVPNGGHKRLQYLDESPIHAIYNPTHEVPTKVMGRYYPYEKETDAEGRPNTYVSSTDLTHALILHGDPFYIKFIANGLVTRYAYACDSYWIYSTVCEIRDRAKRHKLVLWFVDLGIPLQGIDKEAVKHTNLAALQFYKEYVDVGYCTWSPDLHRYISSYEGRDLGSEKYREMVYYVYEHTSSWCKADIIANINSIRHTFHCVLTDGRFDAAIAIIQELADKV